MQKGTGLNEPRSFYFMTDVVSCSDKLLICFGIKK